MYSTFLLVPLARLLDLPQLVPLLLGRRRDRGGDVHRDRVLHAPGTNKEREMNYSYLQIVYSRVPTLKQHEFQGDWGEGGGSCQVGVSIRTLFSFFRLNNTQCFSEAEIWPKMPFCDYSTFFENPGL